MLLTVRCLEAVSVHFLVFHVILIMVRGVSSFVFIVRRLEVMSAHVLASSSCLDRGSKA